MNLTFSVGSAQVSASLAMLVHDFNQSALLAHVAEKVQLIVKPAVVKLHESFYRNLSQLQKLAARRRLIEPERYVRCTFSGLLWPSLAFSELL